MYTLLRNEEFGTYCLKHFISDSTADLANIIVDYKDEPKSKALHPGWTCKVVTTSTTQYILGMDKVWVVDTTSGGGSVDPDREYIWDGGGVSS